MVFTDLHGLLNIIKQRYLEVSRRYTENFHTIDKRLLKLLKSNSKQTNNYLLLQFNLSVTAIYENLMILLREFMVIKLTKIDHIGSTLSMFMINDVKHTTAITL